MQLSTFYTNNQTTTQSYLSLTGSGTWSSSVSPRIATLYNSGVELDKSMFYTMCVDTTYNTVYEITYTEDIRNFNVKSVAIPCEYNANAFLLRESTSSSMYRPIYENGKFYNANLGVNTITEPYDNHFLFPIIFAIKKSDISVNMTRDIFNTSKITRITLKELYKNKNDYYVVSFHVYDIAVSKTSGNKYYDYSTPYIFKGNDTKLLGCCSNAITGNIVNTSISNPVYSANGFNWHRNADGSGGGSKFSLLYPIVDSKSVMNVNLDYGNINIDFTYDNQIFEQETTTGKWFIVSYANGAILETAGKYLMNSDFVLKHIAMYGGFVAWDVTQHSQITLPLLDNSHIAICEMNDKGFTTGEFIFPELKEYYDGINKNGIDYNDTFNPDKYPRENKDDITEPSYRITDQIGGFTMYFKVSQSDLLTIVNRVNFPDSEHPIPEGWEFAPHLVSCTQYPFNVSQYAGGHTSNVIIGSWDSGVNSIALTSTQLAVQTIADFTLERKYNSFLDFSPYAQYQLYIPLCSWVDIPDIAVGKHITVELATDVINNSCVATVKANGCPIVSKVGHMGSSVAISVTENGLKQAALTQSLFSAVGAVTSTGYAIATQNAIGIVNGVASVAGAIAQGNIANNANYTRQIGATSDKSDFHVSNTCYLKISYAQPDEPDNYAHSVGYPCNMSGTVESFSGYTVCSDVDTSGLSCSQNQRETIKRILETGFYI